MKTIACILVFFLALTAYAQELQVKSIHNRHELSMTIFVFSHSDSVTFFIGSLQTTGKVICSGNIAHIDRKCVTKLKDTVIIDLSLADSVTADSSDVVLLGPGKGLKIRFRRFEPFHVPKRKTLKIVFTLNNQQCYIISKRYKRRFCHFNKFLPPDFIKLDKD